MSISIAKATQTSQSSLSSSKISNQANAYAMSEADLLKSVDYSDLTSQSKSAISGSDFAKEISVSAESNYSDTTRQKTVTVKIYKGNETLPRAELKLNRYSVEQKAASGVPIGTVIAWPSTKNPSDGIWLDCNGQNCASYPELVAVLGKNTVPDYRNRFLESDMTPGTLKEAGLPNITGRMGSDDGDVSSVNTEPISSVERANQFTGPFGLGPICRYREGLYDLYLNNDFNFAPEYIDFDASRSNPIYGNSNTVQPASVTVRRLIKAV